MDLVVEIGQLLVATIFLGIVHIEPADARLQPAGAGYVGAGYDVLLGNNDGAHFTSGGPDPGLRLTNVVLRKTLEDYCPIEAICTEVASGTVDDQYSLVADVVQYRKLYSQAWKFESDEELLPLETIFSGLQSSAVADAVTVLQEEKAAVLEKRNSVVVGELRYNYKENTKLTSEFVLTLCDLPIEYDTDIYRRFITSWGTHVIVAVTIGSLDITRYEVPLPNLNRYLATIPSLSKILTVSTGNSTAAYGSETLQEAALVQSLVDIVTARGENLRKWHFTAGTQAVPSPLRLVLRRLDKFIVDDYIDGSVDYLCRSLRDDTNIAWIRSNVKQALLEYPVDPPTPIFRPVRRDFKIDWPKGSYALIKNTYCPETEGSNVWFSTGKREFQDALTVFFTSLSSTDFDMDLVPIGGYGRLTLRFCVKDTDSSAGQTDWPRGSYCIFKKRRCPVGFDEGSVSTPSISLSSDVEALPSGDYKAHKTRFDFCCRRDRPVDEAIILPPSHPFTLLSTGGQCQKVLGMESRLQIQSLRKGPVTGFAPFVTASDSVSGAMKLYFCYYKRWYRDDSS